MAKKLAVVPKIGKKTAGRGLNLKTDLAPGKMGGKRRGKR